MAKKNFYVVKVGAKPGIYKTWDECKAQVNGFSGAVYKGFEKYDEAIEYYGVEENKNTEIEITNTETLQLQNNVDTHLSEKIATKHQDIKAGENTSKKNNDLNLPEIYAFVDGSYNASTSVYGFGGFLMKGDEKYILQGSGNDPEMASMRNVSGEILGAQAAISKAIELGLDKLTILYDYMGIEMWPTGKWKTNKEGTKAYKEFYDSIKNAVDIKFKKVAAHTGIPGNEEADKLAKQAVGIE